MKKLQKKILYCTLIGILSFGILVTTSSAATLSKTANSFTSSWELYVTGDSGRANLTYGYNTWIIKEDYAWANHSTKSHFASLTNGKGSFSGPNKKKKSLSKIEVTHSGSSVTYKVNY